MLHMTTNETRKTGEWDYFDHTGDPHDWVMTPTGDELCVLCGRIQTPGGTLVRGGRTGEVDPFVGIVDVENNQPSDIDGWDA